MRKRTISKFSLLFTSISSIIGSGWLFTMFFTTQLAGPASLLAWIIGAFFITIIAFVFAELTAMIPITGSSTRIPHFACGSVVSFIFAWMIWLSYAALVPTEVQAVLQYLSFFFPFLTELSGALTASGFLLAIVLMALLSYINVYSLRWLIRCNNILTLFKVFIPCLIAITLILFFFTPSRIFHPDGSSFMPFGLRGIFQALSSGGILFSFNGFKQACEIAGDAKNPKKALPFAIIGSISVTAIILLLLQVAFLSSLSPENLIKGWRHLQLSENQSPLAAILFQNRFFWLVPILYIGAIIAPLAAALMYVNSSSRSLFAMSKNGYLPAFFQKITPQGNPYWAIAANFVVGMLLFLPLPGWGQMVRFLSSLIAVTYSIGPIALLSLRYQIPDIKRPFQLPFDKIWCYIAFYLCTLLIYWTGWDVVQKLCISLIFSLIVFVLYHFLSKKGHEIRIDWICSIWLWMYFSGIILISYLGNFGGGKNFIPFGIDAVVIAVFSLIVLYFAVKLRLPAHLTKKSVENLIAKSDDLPIS